MQWVDLLQWPAFVASVLAAWLVASDNEGQRFIGFWVFLASNVLWIAWAWPERAWALVALQLCLTAMNVRGLKKAEPASDNS